MNRLDRSKYLLLFILLVGLYAVYVNYKVYNSYVVQTGVTQNFNTKKFDKENYFKLQNIDITFPNLSVTSFPMSAFLAYFHFVNNQPIKALKLMDSIPSANPYLYAYESMKAEIFNSLGTRDSALYYAKLAHEGLPLNVRHFQQYIQELAYIEDSKTITEVFKKRNEYRDFQFYKFYLAYIMKFKSQEDSEYIDSIAKLAFQRFPNNDEIKAIASFVLYGQENVEKSYALSKEGEKFFNTNDFEYALQAFKKASELNPGDYTFIESTGMTYIKLNQFENAIPYFEKVIDSFKIKDGKSEYGLAISLKETGDLKTACEWLSKSIDRGFQPAYKLFSTTCK